MNATLVAPRACRAAARLVFAVSAALFAAAGWAQDGGNVRGINGSWERYPTASAGLGSDGATTAPSPPEEIPDPPLKPEYLADWRA